ncbi:MAG: hypothetical protein GXX96_38535 [Planctomycetaceae bacterium]|nr:hypothetical protein [Planctomycetaceae bacterium]
MSGGASGLAGYVYQQLYVAYRVLAAVATECLDIADRPPSIGSFGVEAQSTPTGPAWDVRLELTDGCIQLRECKDTAISKKDRKTFYRRIRKEVASGTPASRLSAGWVVNQDKQQGLILNHLDGMRKLADVSNSLIIPVGPPNEVDAADAALQEALYHLTSPCACGETDCTCKTPLSTNDAREIIRHLELDCWRADDLSTSVHLLAENVFANGTGSSIWRYVCGELTDRIHSQGHAEYSVNSFLNVLQTGPLALAASDLLKDLLTFNSAAGHQPSMPVLRWRRLDGEPTKTWPLEERLPGLDGSRSCVVVAPVGTGKSVSSQQAFEEEKCRREPHHVLRVEAQSLDPLRLRALVQLACVLSGVAPTWIAIDGLDEISRDDSRTWHEAIQKLLSIPNLAVLLTARQEVVTSQQWLQKITDIVPEVPLPPLTIEQVCGAFEEVGLAAPRSESLIQALRNTFLFSLYAGVATPDDMPLSYSGAATAFRVVEEFWMRTVLAESIGHRIVGDACRTQQAKRESVAYLVAQTLDDCTTISCVGVSDRVSDGIEMLVREGLLVKHGSQAVQWVHHSVREYAVIDYLISQVSREEVATLLEVLTAISVDWVRRLGAVAGLKWVASHPDWGTPEQYLNQLWTRDRNLAREAITFVVEGSSTVLALARLSIPLLIEAIEQAIVLKAIQWEQQILALPESFFSDNFGVTLNETVTRYELEMGR